MGAYFGGRGHYCWERATPVALIGCVINNQCATVGGDYSALSGAVPAMTMSP